MNICGNLDAVRKQTFLGPRLLFFANERSWFENRVH